MIHCVISLPSSPAREAASKLGGLLHISAVLLAFAPLISEGDWSADNHADFVVSTLAWYGKNVDNVIIIVGDNCPTNIKMACESQKRYSLVIYKGDDKTIPETERRKRNPICNGQ